MAGEDNERGHDKGEQQCHMSEGSAEAFEFLSLPAEIRNMIYWIALVKKYRLRSFHLPALTLVNKQIRLESLPVLYGNGTFVLTMRWWSSPLYKLPPARSILAHVTKLDIRIPIDTHKGGLELEIRMRKNEWECGHLPNKKLVVEPGDDWKNAAKVLAIWTQLLESLVHARGTSLRILADNVLSLSRDNTIIRGLLYSAEKCPAAAEWVWMAPRTRHHST